MTRRPDPSDFYGGPAVTEYKKRGEVWRDEPEPLPEGHPRREAWVARIKARAFNDGGGPTASIRQSERRAPDHGRPFVRRDRRCDDCDEGTPLVDGWHVREPDPEGLEGQVRVRCPNAERTG